MRKSGIAWYGWCKMLGVSLLLVIYLVGDRHNIRLKSSTHRLHCSLGITPGAYEHTNIVFARFGVPDNMLPVIRQFREGRHASLRTYG